VGGSGAPPGAELATAPIPLAQPLLGEAEERAVVEVLRSGRLSLGPRVAKFEELFAARVGAGHASAVASGTAGLHLALRAVGVEDGDEVVTSPFSFVASANVTIYERARPVFADIDPVTLNLEPGAAAAALSERTRALLPVHIFGYPAEMPAFEALARRHRLAIVEDACEALGAVHADGVPVGARGHPAVFGFYANKQLTTGEMNRPPYQKDAGISALFEKAQAIYREIGKELKDVPLTGGGSDGNFTAALGIPTLDGLGADGKGAHAAYEQIYFSSLVPRTHLCARLLETLD